MENIQKLYFRDFSRAKAFQMLCIDLTIYELVSVSIFFYKLNKSCFAGITHLAKHTFSTENMPHFHTVKTSYQLPIFPDFYAFGLSLLV